MDMNKQTYCKITPLLLIVLLTACSSKDKETSALPEKTTSQTSSNTGEVFLATDSPKKAYIKTLNLVKERYPLLEPLAGKITYNENTTTRVRSPVAGRVVTPPAALGNPIKVGDMLLELDSPDVADAEADDGKAQADLMLSSRAYARQKELYEGKVVSRKELEQTESDVTRARNEVKRTQDRLKNLHITAGSSDGRFALRSPVSGVLVERNANVGMEVRPDMESPLFVVSDLKKLTVIMDVYEVNLSKIKLGQQLSVSVPAYPNETFPAKVQYIGQVLNETTRTVQVRCDLPNADGRLLAGMYASITVKSHADDLAIVVPLTAVFTEKDQHYVFVALDDNHFQQRAVTINTRLKDRAIVTDGLQANERLVTEGALMLRVEEDEPQDKDKTKIE